MAAGDGGGAFTRAYSRVQAFVPFCPTCLIYAYLGDIDADARRVRGLRSRGIWSELDQFAQWESWLGELATAIIVTDVAGDVVIWNQAATDLFGWKVDEALGRRAVDLVLDPAFELDALAVRMSVVVSRRWSGDVECTHRNGALLPIHLTITAVYGDDGTVVGFVSESRDDSDLHDARERARNTEHMFTSLLLRTADVAYVTDQHGLIKHVVQADDSALGYSPDELVGTSGLSLTHPDDVLALLSAYAEVAADPSARPSTLYRAAAKDGSWHWREMRMSNLLDDRVVAGIVCNVTDLTDQQHLLRELRAAEARQAAIVARSRDITLFSDAEGTIQWASPVAPELMGGSPQSLVGRNGFDFIHPDDVDRVITELFTMEEVGDHVRTEFRIVDPQGELRWVEEDATYLIDDPDVGYVVSNIRDITDRKNAQEALERNALHDQLTGLPNRLLLMNRLEQLIERNGAAAVLHIDIDNFGEVSDLLGHAAGSQLVAHVAERFAAVSEELPSTLARVADDQFVLLCDEVGDAIAAVSYAERLRARLVTPIRLGETEVFVTTSIGVALSPGDATELLRDARVASQQAKQHGRNRVVMFEARHDEPQQHRLDVQSELHHALRRGELVAWYQPIIDLRTEHVTGVEALVRWNHPVRGLLGTEHFIDVAEASGLMRALGARVLQQACTAAASWRDAGFPLHICVNAAAAQLSSIDYVIEIAAALEEHAIDPDQLTIEITETAAMRVADSLANLHRIRELGVHLALDDFGTGYSSLSFLRELPVDSIKIDRSFVGGIATSPRDASIVEGVIAMANALGFGVVAEGVERAAQAAALRQMGCRAAQGFLWSRAVPMLEVRDVARAIAGDADEVANQV